MTENRPVAKVAHFDEIPAIVFGDEAPGVTIRRLIDEEHDGADDHGLLPVETRRRAGV